MSAKNLIRTFVLMFFDIFFITLSIVIGFLLYKIFNPDYDILKLSSYAPLAILSPIYHIFFNLYKRVSYNIINDSKNMFFSIMMIYSFFITYTFLQKDSTEFSRLLFTFSLVLSLIVMPLSRYYVRLFMGKFNFLRTNVIILGAGRTGQKIYDLLNTNRYIGLNPVLFFDKSAEKIKKIGNAKVIKGIENAHNYIKKFNAEYGILAIPSLSNDETKVIIDLYADRFKQFIILPNLYGISTLWINSVDFSGQLGLQIKHKLILKRYIMTKRLFDFFASLVGAILISPILLIICLLIKFSSKGPIIYSHLRYGRNGKTFPAYKFRSMVQDADKILNDFLEKNPEQKKEWEEDQKLKNDPRITWIGKIIRKTSLDELPQLINVLKGEMSLVGPRPIVENEIQKYGKSYSLYKRVRPGITGLWQVSGRNNTTYDERINYDCYYVRNWSLSLDFYLLFRTIKVVLFREGAY